MGTGRAMLSGHCEDVNHVAKGCCVQLDKYSYWLHWMYLCIGFVVGGHGDSDKTN